MTLKNWIYRKFLAPKQIPKSKVDEALDEYIKSSQKEHQTAISTANKLLKGKLLQQQAREITQKIHDLDPDDDDDDDPSMEDQIQKAIVEKFLGSIVAPATKKPDEDHAYSPDDLKQQAHQSVDKLSPQELEEMKKAGLI